MQHIRFSLSILLIIVSSSCATLNQANFRSMRPTRFEPLTLEPALEANELRVDLIRQSESVKVNDTTSEDRDTPYHPLGFDLGNGMFFDLNGNLSFRLDELLGVSDQDCWSAMETNRRKLRWPNQIYSFCDGYLTVRYPRNQREWELNHQATEGNTISVMYRNRLKYAVEFNDRDVVYRGRRRILETIHQDGEGQYYLKKGWWREHYRLVGDRLFLDRDYIIERTNDNRTLKIIKPGWFSRTLHTIEKSNDQIYIYDRNFRGIRIDFSENGISVYHNRKFAKGWQLTREASQPNNLELR
jgi:hypothetical protein